MSTAIAISTNVIAWGMTRDQIDLLKRTIAQGTTDDEFALFMTTSQRLGLDPFAKQIYAVKRPAYDKTLQRYVDKMAIQVGIDGFRAVADRTGENDGQEGPFWCGEDGVWKDAWLSKAAPAAAMVRVHRKGCSRPFTGIATYRSYAQTSKEGKPVRQWEQMADVMLAKCAEALALRKAFPAHLSGVYAPEEMAQAENETREVSAKSSASGRVMPWDGPLQTCKTADEVRALEPRFAAMRKGSPEAAAARKAYEARLAELEFESVQDAEVSNAR